MRYACVQYPYGGYGLPTPYEAGCTARIYTGAYALHFPFVCVRCGIRLGQPEQCILYVYVCVYGGRHAVVVVVVVVDSHVQRIVLATEETTVTQQVSHRPIKCQSRLWSQRGTKVNGSHHGDNPLLRPTWIKIATKSCVTLQTMTPDNIKTVHQSSSLHIDSNLDRLGLLSPTNDQRSQQQTGQIVLQSVLINKSKFLNATHRT